MRTAKDRVIVVVVENEAGPFGGLRQSSFEELEAALQLWKTNQDPSGD